MRELAKRLAMFIRDLDNYCKCNYEVNEIDEEAIEYIYELLQYPEMVNSVISFLQDVLVNEPVVWMHLELARSAMKMKKELKVLYADQLKQNKGFRWKGAQYENRNCFYR